MTENIDDRIARLRELDKQASPTPWVIRPEDDFMPLDIACPANPAHYPTSPDVMETVFYPAETTESFFCMGDDLPDIQIAVEARNAVPAFIAEIERLQAELRDTHKRYHDRFSRIAAGWRKRRMKRIRAEQEEAWEACADKAYELYLTEEQRDELHAANPYRKEEN